MKLKSYLNESTESIYKKIQEFFLETPKPKDDQVHKFAEKNGIEHSKLEEVVYELLGSFLGAGRSKDFEGEYDPEQLKMGIEVEMEHTTNKFISEKIAKDHLAEFSDYYTALYEMEEELEEDDK